MQTPLELLLQNQPKYHAKARQLALQIANTNNSDPGGLAYKANIITFEELSAVCLETTLSIEQENLNLPMWDQGDLTYNLMAAAYNSTKEEAKEWLRDIRRRSLNYFNYSFTASKRN